MNKQYKKIIIIFILLYSLIVLSGCQNIVKRIMPGDESKKPDENQSQESNQKQNEKKEPPKPLTKIDESLESIIKDIQQVQEAKKTKKEEEQENQGGNQKKDEENQKKGQEDQTTIKQQEDGQKQGEGQKQEKEQWQEEPQDQGQQSQQQNGQEKSQQKADEVDWLKTQKAIEEIHIQWNSFEAQALQDGAALETITHFEEALTQLTNKVLEKNEMSTLIAANQTYQYVSDFLNLYQHKAPPETKRMKFLVQQILFDGQMNKWDLSSDYLQSLERTWEIAQSKIEEKDPNLIQKISLAIDDFRAAVNMKNPEIVKIKGQVLIKDIEAIK